MSCEAKKSRVPDNQIVIAALFLLTWILPLCILIGVGFMASMGLWTLNNLLWIRRFLSSLILRRVH